MKPTRYYSKQQEKKVAKVVLGQCLAYKIKKKEHWVFNDI